MWWSNDVSNEAPIDEREQVIVSVALMQFRKSSIKIYTSK